MKLDKERLLESLTDKQQYIIDHIQPWGLADILGEALDRARTKDH